jgi:hypothetical protein
MRTELQWRNFLENAHLEDREGEGVLILSYEDGRCMELAQGRRVRNTEPLGFATKESHKRQQWKPETVNLNTM